MVDSLTPLGVPRLIVPARLAATPVRWTWPCYGCERVFAAASEEALKHALDAHSRYINAHADRATDPHFDEMRLDALLAS